jgi:hypothetical protein
MHDQQNIKNFTMFIPCTLDNHFVSLNQQNAQTCSLGIYILLSHWLFLHVSVHKGSSSGNKTKEISHKTELDTAYKSG